MIYTLTFNPALDYIIRVPDYVSGAVNRSSDELILPGGKGINVSIVLKNLGIDNVALGFTAGFTGLAFEELVSRHGVCTQFVKLSDGITRINVKIKSDTETEINGNGPVISDDDLNKLYKILKNLSDDDILVMAGSVPHSLPDTVYCDILELISSKKTKIVVDTTGKFLTNVLKFNPFLIKPNNFELGEIFGKTLVTDDDVISCAKELQAMGARNVLVSLGAEGALLLCEDGCTMKHSAPDGKVINTTGSGDSMVAGFLAGYIQKGDYGYALRLGISAGSASAFTAGLATGDEIMNVMNNMK